MPATPLITNYDVSQIFLGKNIMEDFTYTNSTGGTVTIEPGTLMGQILASAKVLPHVSSATDGSEFPRGIAATKYVVTNGSTVTVTLVTRGEVNQSKLILGGSDTLATAIRTTSTGGGVLKTLIEKLGIDLVASTEHSGYDNQ